MEEDVQKLVDLISQSAPLWALLARARELALPPYYIGAGCIAQTVWNIQTGRDPMYGISDIDFVYFDESDLSYEAEDRMIRRVRAALAPVPAPLDIKNQARVHVWYAERFGHAIAPYPSLECAIDSWPTTATAVGVRLTSAGLSVYAPFGLSDLLNRMVRANKAQITEEIYQSKADKWKAKWPELTVVPWEINPFYK